MNSRTISLLGLLAIPAFAQGAPPPGAKPVEAARPVEKPAAPEGKPAVKPEAAGEKPTDVRHEQINKPAGPTDGGTPMHKAGKKKAPKARAGRVAK